MNNIFDDEFNAEDILEETRGTREEILEKNPLPEDNDTPASESMSGRHLPIDHPLNDSGIDAHERYDEGL